MSSFDPIALSTGPARLEFASPDFFGTPLRKMTVEAEPFTGRVYVVKDDRVVAVCKPVEDHP